MLVSYPITPHEPMRYPRPAHKTERVFKPTKFGRGKNPGCTSRNVKKENVTPWRNHFAWKTTRNHCQQTCPGNDHHLGGWSHQYLSIFLITGCLSLCAMPGRTWKYEVWARPWSIPFPTGRYSCHSPGNRESHRFVWHHNCLGRWTRLRYI